MFTNNLQKHMYYDFANTKVFFSFSYLAAGYI